MKKIFTRKKGDISSTLKLLCAGAFALTCFNLEAQTTTFSYTGALQTYTVPVGVTSIQLECWGAQGSGGNGGLGGYTKGDMTVTPGQVLNIYVGGQAGYNGGGLGHAVGNRNGGGASDVRVSPYALADRVIVAGGGGGGGQTDVGIRNGGAGGGGTVGSNYAGGGGGDGYGGNGGPGGLNGGTGNTSCHSGGAGGGGLNSGGAPSCNTCYTSTCGQAGTLGQGGAADVWENGICYTSYGGTNGGGGGYYGGGGSSVGNCGGGGGGGGSSWVGTLTNTTMTGGIRTGNGQIVITVLSSPGAALDFDGVNDVATGTAPNLSGSDFTIEFWAKRRTPSTAEGFFLIGTDGFNNQAIFMYMFSNGGLSFGFWGNDLSINQASGQYMDILWHHYALTYNATTNLRVVYRDGVQIGSDVATADYSGNTNLMIGQFGGHSRTDGAIDEFRIWNRELCQGEIQNNMNCEIPTTGTGLQANYHFNQGVAAGANTGITTLNDASGFNRNCTMTGFGLSGATSNWISPGGVVSGTTCGAFVPAVVTFSSSLQSNISCFGGANGAASVSAVGSGLAYNWTPGNPAGDGTSSVTGLTAGTWTCTVTNSCGGTGTQTFNITEPSVLAATLSSTATACSGGNDGSASASATGGTSPYTYIWSNGGNTATISGLAAGVYTCTVTCANGCTTSQSVTVTQPTAVTATATASGILCNGDTATVTVSGAGGTSPYTGEGTFMEMAGTYSYTVTDANGCTSTTSVTITEPTAISTGATSVDVTCNGGADGSIDLTVSGGTAPYTFDWNSGTYTTEDLTGLSAGTYVGVLTDANGCTDGGTIIINEPAALVATLSIANDTVCSTDGAFALTGESPAGGVFSGPGVSGGLFTPATAGVGVHVITYVYTDSSGCTASTTDSISVDVCTGTQVSGLVSEVSIYPNPNDGTFTLQVASASDVTIYDAQGKLVLSQKVQPNVVTPMNITSAGMYMITVVTADGQHTSQRVMVTK